jgi:hypothetical protein
MKKWKIEGSAMDSRTVKRWIRRWLWRRETIVMWFSQVSQSTNYSNVFAKDRHSFAMWVYLLASARFQTFYLTPTNPMQPPFSKWYNPDKRWDVMVGSSAISIEQMQEFQESSSVCERWCHRSFCPRTSSEWHVIENVWQNTDIARKDDSIMAMNCQSYCCAMLHFCFVITSHPSTKHVFSLSSCCFEIKRYLFQMVFWQNILIKLQHAKLKIINPED